VETTFDYLRQFGPILAERILETYPPLQSTKDPVAPGLAGLLRRMRTAQLDQIVRQKDHPELKAVVERLARGDVATGISLLQQQGRVAEIADRAARIQAIARDFAANPDNTLIVSPDNASRREINDAVHQELQGRGIVNAQNHSLRVLIPRQELTGAERQWASRYESGDVIRYARGSKEPGIERGSYARVVAVNPAENLLSVEKPNTELATYDPKRLRGVSVYRELEREFAIGDRIQFTAPYKHLEVANRDLAAIVSISPYGEISARLDDGRTIAFSNQDNRHFDHGYAVTSHSSQGLTASRVLIHVDTSVHLDLINSRFAYVSVSRASREVTLFTDDMTKLSPQLSADVSKTSALRISQTPAIAQGIRMM
jgi:ATP-dependent exoDNAse (exonuclease V) alpha subunit